MASSSIVSSIQENLIRLKLAAKDCSRIKIQSTKIMNSSEREEQSRSLQIRDISVASCLFISPAKNSLERTKSFAGDYSNNKTQYCESMDSSKNERKSRSLEIHDISVASCSFVSPTNETLHRTKSVVNDYSSVKNKSTKIMDSPQTEEQSTLEIYDISVAPCPFVSPSNKVLERTKSITNDYSCVSNQSCKIVNSNKNGEQSWPFEIRDVSVASCSFISPRNKNFQRTKSVAKDYSSPKNQSSKIKNFPQTEEQSMLEIHDISVASCSFVSPTHKPLKRTKSIADEYSSNTNQSNKMMGSPQAEEQSSFEIRDFSVASCSFVLPANKILKGTKSKDYSRLINQSRNRIDSVQIGQQSTPAKYRDISKPSCSYFSPANKTLKRTKSLANISILKNQSSKIKQTQDQPSLGIYDISETSCTFGSPAKRAKSIANDSNCFLNQTSKMKDSHQTEDNISLISLSFVPPTHKTLKKTKSIANDYLCIKKYTKALRTMIKPSNKLSRKSLAIVDEVLQQKLDDVLLGTKSHSHSHSKRKRRCQYQTQISLPDH